MHKSKIFKKLSACACTIALIAIGAGAAIGASAQSPGQGGPWPDWGYGGGKDCSAEVVAPDGGFSIVINNGAETTDKTHVNLQLQGGTAKYMQISENGSFWWAPIVPYKASYQTTLSQWNGDKTVNVRYFNVCRRNPTASVSDSIKLLRKFAWWWPGPWGGGGWGWGA